MKYCWLIFVLFLGCSTKVKYKNNSVFKFKNMKFSHRISEKEGLRLNLSVRNPEESPIVVSLGYDNSIYITNMYGLERNPSGEISIVDTGTEFNMSKSIDTILYNQTNNYSPLIITMNEFKYPQFDTLVFCFSYYHLNDFEKNSFNSQYENREYFFLFKKKDKVEIKKISNDFVPSDKNTYVNLNL